MFEVYVGSKFFERKKRIYIGIRRPLSHPMKIWPGPLPYKPTYETDGP